MSRRILIVGGVAGGASAATRARRLDEHAEIVLYEMSGYVSYANCGLPYHVAGRIANRDALLLVTPDVFRDKFNIDVRLRHEVVRIDRAAKQIEAVDHGTGGRVVDHYDRLILSPGARAIVPPWPGAKSRNVFPLRSVEDMDRLNGWISATRPAKAVVVGAGFIGLETVEALVERGVAVSLVELADQVLPPLDREMAAELEDELRANGVALHLGTPVESLSVEGDLVTGVRLSDGTQLPADLVLLSIGVKPNVELARDAGLDIGPTGAIAVNAFQQTSDPDIYAVGDVAEAVHGVTGRPAFVPLAGPANKQGRLAGEHAVAGRCRAAAKVNATAIVAVFKKTAAMTGLSAKAALRAEISHAVAYAIRGHHVGYYPGSEPMILKLLYDPQTGKVLGAQAVGGAGVDKRIDVVSTALHFGGTVDDLASLDLAYAPQFGAAKDPLHIAAFVAGNALDGYVTNIHELPDPLIGQLVDVREPSEVARGALPGAVNIPLGQLRHRLGELRTDQPVTVYCQVGQRGYNAARILAQHGFGDVRNLVGGYRIHGRA